MPVTSDSANAKSSTDESMPVGTVAEASGGINVMSPARVRRATNKPAMPPSSASVHDSTSNCVSSCRRLAPIDKRTAISPARPAPFASRRFAMLAHAVSNTSAVTPISKISGARACAWTLL